jgi:cobalt transporter subunit CbtA
MKLLQSLVWAALAVALLVGGLQTAVQQHWALPLILQAEAFEAARLPDGAQQVVGLGSAVAHDHEHAHSHSEADAAAKAWAPENGVERTFWTWVANTLHAFGMAQLALVALGFWVWRHGTGVSAGALGLGIAVVGFVSLHLWPALGLPAEIPGLDAARLGSRQGWWLLAAGSALTACVVLAASRAVWRWPLAVGLLALPLLVGAPQLAGDPLAGHSAAEQVALRALGQQFIFTTHAIAVSLWLSLGLASGWAFVRWVQPQVANAVQNSSGSPP